MVLLIISLQYKIKLIKICDQWDLGFVNTKINNSFGLGNHTKRYKIVNEQPIHFYSHKQTKTIIKKKKLDNMYLSILIYCL